MHTVDFIRRVRTHAAALAPAAHVDVEHDVGELAQLAAVCRRVWRAKPTARSKVEQRKRGWVLTTRRRKTPGTPCALCHLPWPHDRRARTVHALRMLHMKKFRPGSPHMVKLAGGHPWGEQFRALGKAAMARNAMARAVQAFEEIAPDVVQRLGRPAIEEIIGRRRAELRRRKLYILRAWIALHWGPNARPHVHAKCLPKGPRRLEG